MSILSVCNIKKVFRTKLYTIVVNALNFLDFIKGQFLSSTSLENEKGKKQKSSGLHNSVPTLLLLLIIKVIVSMPSVGSPPCGWKYCEIKTNTNYTEFCAHFYWAQRKM